MWPLTRVQRPLLNAPEVRWYDFPRFRASYHQALLSPLCPSRCLSFNPRFFPPPVLRLYSSTPCGLPRPVLTAQKTKLSALQSLGSSLKFFPPTVSSKVLKRIARICSLHQSPATRIVLRLYHSHSSPSGDLKLLASQRFSLNSHSPNSSTGIHFFVFFSI